MSAGCVVIHQTKSINATGTPIYKTSQGTETGV